MEGMDAVKRLKNEHQLTESKWETGFNMYIHLQDLISLYLEWIKTDVIAFYYYFKFKYLFFFYFYYRKLFIKMFF